LASFLPPILAGLVLLLAPTAHAQRCQAPPGLSALEQYCETIPSARGDSGPGDADPGSPPLLRPSVRRALAHGGADARQLLTFLDKYGALPPDGLGRGRPPSSDTRSSGEPGAAADRTAANHGVLGAIKSSVEAGPTMGGLLPWLLLALASLALVAGLLRARMRRSGRPE